MKQKKLKPADLAPGDYVVIRHRENWLEGEVKYADGQWFIEAFKTKIVFAKDGKDHLGPKMVPGVDLRGHTTQLINEGA